MTSKTTREDPRANSGIQPASSSLAALGSAGAEPLPQSQPMAPLSNPTTPEPTPALGWLCALRAIAEAGRDACRGCDDCPRSYGFRRPTCRFGLCDRRPLPPCPWAAELSSSPYIWAIGVRSRTIPRPCECLDQRIAAWPRQQLPADGRKWDSRPTETSKVFSIEREAGESHLYYLFMKMLKIFGPTHFLGPGNIFIFGQVISSETHRQAIGERGLACTGSPSVSHLPSGVVGHHNGAHACTGCAVQAAAPPTNLRDWAQVHGEGVAPAAMSYNFYETTKQPAIKASWTTASRPATSTVFQPIVVQQVPCAHPSSCRL